MATTGDYSGSIAHQFPQPSRPLPAYYTNIQPMVPENSTFSDQYFNGFHDIKQNWTNKSGEQNRFPNHERDDLRQILREFAYELDKKGFEKCNKLVSKVKKKVPIERLFKETLDDFRGSHASEVFEKYVGKLKCREVKDRDVSGDILTATEGEELRGERFKVKMVNVPGVGVVKEEEN